MIAWMMPAGSSAKLEVEAQTDACFVAVVHHEAPVELCLVAAAGPEVHDYDKIGATEVYHT